ncbi:MAG: DUF2505 domain-containing protein [Mycobacterium sp.]|nr:DUF2505 domain-containing protein [Mycobacterium sp.]
MARHMAYTVDVGVPTELLYRDLTTIDYWEALVEAYRENSARTEIAHFATGPGGTDVVFAHIFSAQDLPPIARPIVPGTFVVTREQHFDPFEEVAGRACGHYRAEVPGVPVDIDGTYMLTAMGAGSQMQIDTRCAVRVPIIGGQIESMLVTGLKTLFANEGEHTAEWIAGHH